MVIQTPYYLIDETILLTNLKKIQYLRKLSGVKSVLALKCFATWSVFPLMSEYMDGTTSSSLFEARLGCEEFGKETHAYSVAFSEQEVREIVPYASKVIFNSLSQFQAFKHLVGDKQIGLRVNPQISHSGFELANPTCRYSRLGVLAPAALLEVADEISGVMFHCNCENDSVESFANILEHISGQFAEVLHKLSWVSLGGGIYFTKPNYPLEILAEILKDFSVRFNVQVYLEPGEATITQAGELVTSVLDIVDNEQKTAIVDASTEAHMLDLLIYRLQAKIANHLPDGAYEYRVAGRSCLAGDVFGSCRLAESLKIGDQLSISDAAGYSMVKKNWFNGLQMPSIVVKRLDGSLELVQKFGYEEFKSSLS